MVSGEQVKVERGGGGQASDCRLKKHIKQMAPNYCRPQ